MSTEAFPYDVFLSHSGKDKAVVRPLAERLRQDGPHLKAECRRKKAEILHSSFILHPSPCACGSDWAQLEADTFRYHDPLNKARRFIPLRLDAAPIKGSLTPSGRQAAPRNSTFDKHFPMSFNAVELCE